MSTRVGPIEAFSEPFRPQLEALVRNFERDAARAKRLIRQLAEEDREKFYRTALQLLLRGLDSPGVPYLIGILSTNGMLLKALVDPRISREQALEMAQAASRVDPNAETALARVLSGAIGTPDAADHADDQARLMEILTAISDGAKIFPYLVRLLRHPNPHIRSKAVLMIGRGNRSPIWVRQKLADADPRIRANAAEALWGVGTAESRDLLHALVQDSNNRVAGNAVLGLYRLGDQGAIPEILAMARHELPMFRATAAWVMGTAGDPRFSETLAGLLRDPHPVVRKRAFSALRAVRASAAQAREGPAWRLPARLLEAEPGKPARRLVFGVVGEAGGGAPSILPTQVLASEDGQNITQYRLIERPLPETMSIVFVLPRSRAEAVRACLPWKRPTDLWGFLYYARESAGFAAPGAGPPRFHSSAEAIAAELERVPSAGEYGGFLQAVARAVAIENGIQGKRRVILINEPAKRAAPGDDLAGGVAAAQAFVQAVSFGPDPAVAEFCDRVNGVYREGDEAAIVDVYLNLLTRYELVYQPINWEAQSLHLRLHGPSLWAETKIALR